MSLIRLAHNAAIATVNCLLWAVIADAAGPLSTRVFLVTAMLSATLSGVLVLLDAIAEFHAQDGR